MKYDFDNPDNFFKEFIINMIYTIIIIALLLYLSNYIYDLLFKNTDKEILKPSVTTERHIT